MTRLYIIMLAIAVTVSLQACKEPVTPASPPVGHAAESAEAIFGGVITEVIEVDNYTYLKIESGDASTWIATNLMWVREGDSVSFRGGALMKDFYSATLNRTFESILFVDEITVTEAGAPQMADTDVDRVVGSSSPPHPIKQPSSKVPVMANQTVAGIFAAYPGIDGQTVSVAGTVLKFSQNVMGTNWVTLQDGTGIAPDNTLVAKTSDGASIGEQVMVTGTARVDVRLGHGYEYKVLLEGAHLSLMSQVDDAE